MNKMTTIEAKLKKIEKKRNDLLRRIARQRQELEELNTQQQNLIISQEV